MQVLKDLKAKVSEKVRKVQTKVANKFRGGNHEKGMLGAGIGAVLIALGGTGFLGNQINNMVSSVAGSSSSSSTSSSGAPSIATFVNDVVIFIGLISLIIGLLEFRRIMQIRKLISPK